MEELKLGFYRIFGQELVPPAIDTDVSIMLHQNRALALHEVFDDVTEITVLNWGDTDDAAPHEYVSLAVGLIGPVLVKHVVLPAVKSMFEKIADKAIDTVFEKAVSWIVLKMKKKQDEKKIGEYHITLANGTAITVTNPKEGSKLRFVVNGEWQEVEF
jgi:hypothetical protein